MDLSHLLEISRSDSEKWQLSFWTRSLVDTGKCFG